MIRRPCVEETLEGHPDLEREAIQRAIEYAAWLTQAGQGFMMLPAERTREAIGLLRKTRGLMARIGRAAEFARYLESVRAAHKPKRNFMKLLERAKWE